MKPESPATSPQRNCSTLIAATGVASARSVRCPIVIRRAPCARAPSTPTRPTRLRGRSNRRVLGRRLRAQHRQRLDASPLAPGSTSISMRAAAGSSRYASSVSGRPNLGKDCPPDCFTDASATRRQRSSRAPARQRRHGRFARVVTSGWTARTPSITASRTMSSILSPLSTAWARVRATPGSAAASTRARSAPARPDGQRARPAPLNSCPGRRTPPPCRRRRAAAHASGARLVVGSVTARRRDRARSKL